MTRSTRSLSPATRATLEAMEAVAADGNADWRSLPPDAYCNPEIHALERDRIFRAGWIALGRADEVAEAGRYLAREVVGEPVAMVRGRDGQLASGRAHRAPLSHLESHNRHVAWWVADKLAGG